MDDHADFDNVSWPRQAAHENSAPPMTQTDPSDTSLPTRLANGKRSMSGQIESEPGELADPVDLAGIADGIIECTVDTPLKENDGTKDAYVSYLITTNVSIINFATEFAAVDKVDPDRLQILSKAPLQRP